MHVHICVGRLVSGKHGMQWLQKSYLVAPSPKFTLQNLLNLASVTPTTRVVTQVVDFRPQPRDTRLVEEMKFLPDGWYTQAGVRVNGRVVKFATVRKAIKNL